MELRQSQRIIVYGRVQGVGFRPTACRLGDELGLEGYVRNSGGFVELLAAGSEAMLKLFIERIQQLPLPIKVTRAELESVTEELFRKEYARERAKLAAKESFFAAVSNEYEQKSFSPADLAICAGCLEELNNSKNRRYRYPYISCAKCGPRYTIMHKLPYDRQNTTMKVFELCSECQGEYKEFGGLRHHAETISCTACGPQLYAYTKDNRGVLRGEAALAKALELIKAEELIMVKALGGYNLVCLATSERAVAKLRILKQRPTKPFAIMCGSLEQAEELCQISTKERELLLSAARPIVLLRPKNETKQLLAKGVAEQCSSLGVMLPAMGFYQQLCDLGLPLVVTSCNYSGAPIIYEDKKALSFYEHREVVAGVFTYERDILRPADDSVARVVLLSNSEADHSREAVQLLRRARGYLPEPINTSGPLRSETAEVLAMGGEMEPSFCLSKGQGFYVAELPGHLDEESTETEYLAREQDWEQLLELKPQLIIGDAHPGYYSTALGQQLAKERGLSLIQLQHHQAHALSVMAEYGLAEECLAVCFDGTGYGSDGTIWGGEFLLCKGTSYERLTNLEAVPMLGGDGSMKQPWKSAMCYGLELEKAALSNKEIDMNDQESLNAILKKDAHYGLVKTALEHQLNLIKNSSMGRLFDAASFILGLATENTHQGHCAQALEEQAQNTLERGLAPMEMHFVEASDMKAENKKVWSAREILLKLAKAAELGKDEVGPAALGFHRAIIELVVRVAKQAERKRVLLCGGCFANRILLEGCYEELTKLGFEVYFNQSVAPGDGGLALGQAYYGALLSRE